MAIYGDEMLRDPVRWLSEALRTGAASGVSSLELARRTGVPASTIRSLRNGAHADMYASSWGPLAAEVLACERAARRAA